jgi:hypothetical protein
MAGARSVTVVGPARPAAAPARVVQRACACGSKGSGECESCKKKKLQRRAGSRRAVPASVDAGALERGGEQLPGSWRDRLEPLFGASFATVRLHDDAASHAAAQTLNAHAFTIGQHIHFAAGQYRPDERAGLHLLAHELTHTVQQRGMAPEAPQRDGVVVDPIDSPLERAADRAADRVVSNLDSHSASRAAVPASRPMIQRVGVGEFFSRLFGEGTFSEAELQRYLQYLDDHAAIEGDYDSDNKAREIVRRWRRGDPKFRPSLTQKQLMLLEMIDGPTLDDDEQAILELLRGSNDADVRALIATAGGEESLKGEFHWGESDELDRFLEAWHRKPGNQPAPQRTAGDRRPRIVEIVVNQDTPQFVTIRYNDGRLEASRCSTGKGTCCVEPGSATGPSAAQTQVNDSNWTPVGSHTVQFTQAMHGEIAWWTQFHSRAIALHEYAPVDGTPISHGCVRLSGAFAKRIHEGVVPGRTVVRVVGSPRPRCDHAALKHEWDKDFAGGAAADGDKELRRHLEVSFGVRGAALDRQIAAGVIPRCGGGATRSGQGAGGRR